MGDANVVGLIAPLVSRTETDRNYSETNIGSFGYTCGLWKNE